MVGDTSHATGQRPIVSRARGVPLYRQIAESLRAGIKDGTWSAGSQLPPESELVTTFQASRLTVRRGLELLEHEGLLSRQPGRGTFVLDPVITEGPHFSGSFTRELAARDVRSGAKVLQQAVVRPPQNIARRLGLTDGDAVVLIERVRTGNAKIIGLQQAWLPERLFPGLDQIDLNDASLYEVLSTRYAVGPTSGEEEFSLVHVDHEIAAKLEVDPGTAVFHQVKLTTTNGRPMEYLQAYLRGDRYRIQLRI